MFDFSRTLLKTLPRLQNQMIVAVKITWCHLLLMIFSWTRTGWFCLIKLHYIRQLRTNIAIPWWSHQYFSNYSELNQCFSILLLSKLNGHSSCKHGVIPFYQGHLSYNDGVTSNLQNSVTFICISYLNYISSLNGVKAFYQNHLLLPWWWHDFPSN